MMMMMMMIMFFLSYEACQLCLCFMCTLYMTLLWGRGLSSQRELYIRVTIIDWIDCGVSRKKHFRTSVVIGASVHIYVQLVHVLCVSHWREMYAQMQYSLAAHCRTAMNTIQCHYRKSLYRSRVSNTGRVLQQDAADPWRHIWRIIFHAWDKLHKFTGRPVTTHY